MKFKTILFLTVLLIFLCCIGAASAADDINNDTLTTDNEAVVLDNGDNLNLQSDASDDTTLEVNENDDILELTPADTIYVNESSTNPVTGRNARTTTGADWDTAYGTQNGLNIALRYINKEGTIIVAPGNYSTAPDYETTLLNRYETPFTIEGYGDNVLFSFSSVYNLDTGSAQAYGDMHDGIYVVNTVICHKNIIFDCDVKVGSRNFNFTDCTFNKGVEISRDYISDHICNITFENCKFANPKSDIVVADKNNVVYNACTFPVTAVDSAIDITSSEKGVVVITLTNGTAPVVGATVKYTINGGAELSNLTDGNGQIKITDLKGLVDVLANFTGNDAYNANSTSKSFDFRDNTNIIISNESKVIIITLTDGTAPVVGATVKYTINGGAELSNLTDGNGQIKITEVPDEFEINATYLGDNLYNQSSNSQKFNFTKPPVNNNTDDKNNSNVKPTDNNKKTDQQKTKVTKKATKITAKKATFKAKKKTKKYSIILKAGKKAISKVKVTIKVGKKTYTAKTNAKGKATFNLKKLTKKGKYTAVIKFAGNKNYKATSTKVKITVKK